MKRILAIAAGLVVVLLVLLRTEAGQLLLGNWSFTDYVREDDGTFFRLKVKLAYKGEKQDFDIVVACHVKVIGYKDGGSTYEAGLTPTVYGRQMSDGKGLVIRAPDACSGETTANGKVPPDFMPVVVVYDDAKTLGFGTAYISDEAYESPLSLLKFDGATVEKATKTEFEDFRRNGPPNLVTRERYHSVQPDDVLAKMGLSRVWPPLGRTCYAVGRFRIPEDAREAVRQLWPAERPRYWSKADQEAKKALFGLVWRVEMQRDDGAQARRLGSYSGDESMADHGVANRQGGGMIRLQKYPASFYPASTGLSADKWPVDSTEQLAALSRTRQVAIAQIVFDEAKARGFAYCYHPPSATFALESAKQISKIPDLPSYVDEEAIVDADRDWSNAIKAFLENDEFYFRPYHVFLDSTRGDV